MSVLLAAVVFGLWASCLWPAEPAVEPAATSPTPADDPTSEVKSQTTAPPRDEELRLLVEQFREQRREFLAAREQLREQLRHANEEERRAILQAFAEEHREQMAAQRELRREFRRQYMELRRQRRHHPGGGPGRMRN